MAFQILQLSTPEASVSVCPERGGLVTGFRVGAEELLYLDPATFEDASKSVRGGIPILFPIAGPAPQGSLLSQHGFARTSPWQTVSVKSDELILRLSSSPESRQRFPHDFQLDYRIQLDRARLHLAWTVRAGSDGLPLQFGLHPYFAVPLDAKASARVDTNATRAWDNVQHASQPVHGSPPFGDGEVDLHLLDGSLTQSVLHRGAHPPIRLRWSPSFHTLVLWTQPGKPFICVEPWSAPALPAREGAPLPVLEANAEAKFELELSL